MEMELLVRALIIRDRKILVCQTRGRDYFFLPGGHIEFGETMQEALNREISEEMGAKVVRANFIGGVENLFQQDATQKHEISFVFQAEIDSKEVVSIEDHITFSWLAMDEFIDSNVLPPALKDAVIRWTTEKEPFFVEEKTNK